MPTPRTVCVLIALLSLPLIGPLTAVPASAADFGYRGLDLHAGLAFPSSFDDGWIAGVSVNVGEMVPGLYLYPGVFYSKGEKDSSFPDGSVHREASALSVGAEVRYFLNREPVGFYFGGGPYVHRIDSEVAFRNGPVTVGGEDDETSLGAIAVAGYRFDFNESLSGALEARYNSVSAYDGGSVLFVLGF